MTTSPIPEVDYTRENPNEYTEVERKLLVQSSPWDGISLRVIWTILPRLGAPASAKPRCGAPARAFRRINKDEQGQEWLDDLTLDRAARELLRPKVTACWS